MKTMPLALLVLLPVIASSCKNVQSEIPSMRSRKAERIKMAELFPLLSPDEILRILPDVDVASEKAYKDAYQAGFEQGYRDGWKNAEKGHFVQVDRFGQLSPMDLAKANGYDKGEQKAWFDFKRAMLDGSK